jgi:hypothetical protein
VLPPQMELGLSLSLPVSMPRLIVDKRPLSAYAQLGGAS